MPDNRTVDRECAYDDCHETKELRRCIYCGRYYCKKHVRPKIINAPSWAEVGAIRPGGSEEAHPCPGFTSRYSQLAGIPQKESILESQPTELPPVSLPLKPEPSSTTKTLESAPLQLQNPYSENQQLKKIFIILVLIACAVLFYLSLQYLQKTIGTVQNMSNGSRNNSQLYNNVTVPNITKNESLRTSDLGKDVLDELNAVRTKHGLEGLDWNDQLVSLATIYSNTTLLYQNTLDINASFGGFKHSEVPYTLYLYESCTFNASGALKYCTYAKHRDAVSKIVSELMNKTSNQSLLSADFTDAGVGLVTNGTSAYIAIILTNYNTKANLKKIQGDASRKLLPYVLRGEEDNVNFTVYSGIDKMLSGLPRYFVCNPKCPSQTEQQLYFLDQKDQKNYLKPMIDEIKSRANARDDQARIAISLVQKIPYDWDGIRTNNLHNRYPYEVVYENTGICAEKSRLLAFILRDLGYGVVLFYYKSEDHMTVGVRCPMQYSYMNTGYCFIETTGPSIPTDDKGTYAGIGKLTSTPELLFISDGASFDSISEEYKDAQEIGRIRGTTIVLGSPDYQKLLDITTKYGIKISH